MYKHSNNKSMTSGAIAAMLSTILYGRRFFPYYVYNIIGGLDEEGEFVRENKDSQRWFHMLKYKQFIIKLYYTHFFFFIELSI